MKVIGKIVRNEIKYHTIIPVILSHMIYILIFVLFGVVELKKDIVLMVIERFLPLMGIILISPCFEYEMDSGIKDIIRSKSTSILATYLVRLFLRILAYGILTILFIGLLKNTGSYLEMGLYISQSLSIGLLLGSIGLFAFGISLSLIGSYLAPLIYYLLNWMPNWKSLGDFYLFRLRQGLEPRIGLNIFLSILLFILGLYLKKHRDKHS